MRDFSGRSFCHCEFEENVGKRKRHECEQEERCERKKRCKHEEHCECEERCERKKRCKHEEHCECEERFKHKKRCKCEEHCECEEKGGKRCESCNKHLAKFIRENFKGARITITLVGSDEEFRGEVVDGFDNVIALKCRGVITFINACFIATFV